MIRLCGAVLQLVLAWFVLLGALTSPASADVVPPTSQGSVFAYDAPHGAALITYNTNRRGPATTYAADRWSRGALTGQESAVDPASKRYTIHTLLVQPELPGATTREQVRRANVALSSRQRLRVAANAGRRAFDIHPRVSGQLNDPRLGALRGKLTPDDLQDLAHNPNANYLLDSATGNINVIQEVDGVILRITTPRDAFKIISVGRMRPDQVPNGLESGRFVPIGPGG